MPTIDAPRQQLVTVSIDGRIVLSAELINCQIDYDLGAPCWPARGLAGRVARLSLEAFEPAQVLPACSRPGVQRRHLDDMRKPVRGGGITC